VNINQVNTWDGEDNLIEEDESSMLVDNETPVPPAHILQLFDEATPAIMALQMNVHDKEALRFIKLEISKKITEKNKEMGFQETGWHIDEAPLITNFTWAQKHFEDLAKDPDNSEPKEALQGIKTVLDKLVKTRHYPESWSIPENFLEIAKTAAKTRAQAETDARAEVEAARKRAEAEAARKRPEAENLGKGSNAESADVVNTGKAVRIKYPWQTMKTQHGELIIGLRRRGIIGHQVCVEAEESDGRIIRKLASGSEVGLLDVAKYKNMDGHKDLAEGQSKWSFEDREDFEELLFVTATKRKSIYGNNRDPGADCCVRFSTKGIHMLTVSSFCKVLGAKSAKREIEEVCDRDGILPPWKEEMITEDNDPKAGKRRQKPSWLPSGKADEDKEMKRKVDSLEGQLSDMTKKMDILTELLTKLAAPPPLPQEEQL